MSKVIFYIATSEDGFIADTNGGVDWLPQPHTAEDLEIVGYNQLMSRIETIVMGVSMPRDDSPRNLGIINRKAYGRFARLGATNPLKI